MAAPSPRIIRLVETASTNADAMRLALAGEALPLWVTAERQTAGRGRDGRSWLSGPGNLHASLAITTLAPLQRAGDLSLVAGIALLDTVKSVIPLAQHVAVRLKWPNDVLIGSAKAGGVLVETTTARAEPGFLAVLGFGVNIATRPAVLDREVTALSDHGVMAAATDLLAVLAQDCTHWLAMWNEGRNFGAIRTEWIKRAGPIGETVSVNTNAGPQVATYLGLAESGALLVEIDGQQKTISYGDVSLVTRADKNQGG